MKTLVVALFVLAVALPMLGLPFSKAHRLHRRRRPGIHATDSDDPWIAPRPGDWRDLPTFEHQGRSDNDEAE
jgi:hypothetical protein